MTKKKSEQIQDEVQCFKCKRLVHETDFNSYYEICHECVVQGSKIKNITKKQIEKQNFKFRSIEEFEKKYFPKDFKRKQEQKDTDKINNIKRCPCCETILPKNLYGDIL